MILYVLYWGINLILALTNVDLTNLIYVSNVLSFYTTPLYPSAGCM